jgi:hypothetical protein
MTTKVVKFNEDIIVIVIDCEWIAEYQDARSGTYAFDQLDRMRFQKRIIDAEIIISSILHTSHRYRMLERNNLLLGEELNAT